VEIFAGDATKNYIFPFYIPASYNWLLSNCGIHTLETVSMDSVRVASDSFPCLEISKDLDTPPQSRHSVVSVSLRVLTFNTIDQITIKTQFHLLWDSAFTVPLHYVHPDSSRCTSY